MKPDRRTHCSIPGPRARQGMQIEKSKKSETKTRPSCCLGAVCSTLSPGGSSTSGPVRRPANSPGTMSRWRRVSIDRRLRVRPVAGLDVGDELQRAAGRRSCPGKPFALSLQAAATRARRSGSRTAVRRDEIHARVRGRPRPAARCVDARRGALPDGATLPAHADDVRTWATAGNAEDGVARARGPSRVARRRAGSAGAVSRQIDLLDLHGSVSLVVQSAQGPVQFHLGQRQKGV